MPQDKLQQLMMNRPVNVTGEVKYPEPGPNDVAGPIMRGAGAFLGLEDQLPGDLASGLGAMGSMLPVGRLGKLLKFLQKKPKSGIPQLPKPNMPHEFHQMPQEGSLADLSQVEIDKAIDLAKPRPHLEKPGGKANHVPTPPKNEENNDKLLRLMTERRMRGPTNHNENMKRAKTSIPAFRTKSGTIMDVMDDMKKSNVRINDADLYSPEMSQWRLRALEGKAPTPPVKGGTTNELTDFVDYLEGKQGATPTLWTDSFGYEGPVGAKMHPAEVDAALDNPMRRDPAGDILMESDPDKLVARLKGVDDSMAYRNPEDIAMDKEVFGKQLENPKMIDNLLQDLSDYFTIPKFDPFVKQNAKDRDLFWKEFKKGK